MCSIKKLGVILLVAVNFVFAACGLLLAAFGVASIFKPEAVVKLFEKFPELTERAQLAGFDIKSTLHDSALFAIILGGIVALVGIFGCVGACVKSKPLLTAYIFVLVLILLAEIGLILFAVFFPDTFQEKIQIAMNETLVKYTDDGKFEGGKYQMPTSEIELAWASLQFGLGCCGAYGYMDYKLSNLSSSHKVPVSCCSLENGPGNIPTQESDFNDLHECLAGKEAYINPQDCYQGFVELLNHSLRIAIGIAVSIIGVEIILILLAAWISNSIDKGKSMAL